MSPFCQNAVLLLSKPYTIAKIPPIKQPIYNIVEIEKTNFPKVLKQNVKELSNFLHLKNVNKIL